MSDKNQETIADIVKEMRGNAEHNHALGEVSKYLNEIADRIEAAANREREAGAEKMRENLGEVMHKKYTAQICGDIGEMVGREAACHKPVTDCHGLNAAAMREALEQAKRVLHCAIVADILKGEDARKAFNAVTATLSSPPRNCDVLSGKQEALAAIHEDRCYVNNPIDERRLTVE